VISAVETGIRQGIFSPDLRGERLEWALMQNIGGHSDMIHERIRKLGYLSQGEILQLNLSSEINQDTKVINLFFGVLKRDWVSLDLILPWTEIYRASQIVSRYPDVKPLRSFDVPSMYKLFTGRMGIYTGENYEREEILHDWGWDYSVVSGRRSHKLFTWQNPAFIWTAIPDTAYVSRGQINLPLQNSGIQNSVLSQQMVSTPGT